MPKLNPAFAKEALLALLLLVAAGLVVWGVRLLSEPLAFITAGVLLAVLTILFLADFGGSGAPGS